MSGEPELVGLAKTFNSTTFTGRANVAKATYGGNTVLLESLLLVTIRHCSHPPDCGGREGQELHEGEVRLRYRRQ